MVRERERERERVIERDKGMDGGMKNLTES